MLTTGLMENKGYHFLVTHNSFPFSSVGRGWGWGGPWVGWGGGGWGEWEEAGGEGCQESLVCSETQREHNRELSFTPAPPLLCSPKWKGRCVI